MEIKPGKTVRETILYQFCEREKAITSRWPTGCLAAEK